MALGWHSIAERKKKKPTTKPRILYPGKLSFKTEYHPAISKKKQIIDIGNNLFGFQ